MAIKPPNNWRTTIETLTKQQLEIALALLEDMFKDDPNYQDLSQSGKEIFASALIKSFDLIKR